MSSLKTNSGIIPLKHIGCCIKFLQKYQTMPRLSYIFYNWLFIQKQVIVDCNFQYVYIQLQIFFSNKNEEKMLKFSKLMIFMQQMEYNALNMLNCMYVFHNFSEVKTPRLLLVL